MNRSVFARLLVVAALLTVAGSIATVTAAAYTGSPDPGTAGDDPASDRTLRIQDTSTEQQFDRTYFEITVHENGSATWTFRHERSLDADSGEVEAFESFAEEFESQETDLYNRFTRQAEGLTATGEERTDREMEATAFNRSAGVEHRFRETGVVEMSFRWEGFAAVEDDGTVVVGDVFDGLYLEPDQHLVLEPGGNLVFVRAQPEGEYTARSIEDANSITWRGEQEFIIGQPRVVLENEAAAGSDGSPVPVEPGWLVAATVLVVTLAAAGAVVWRRAALRADSSGTAATVEEDAGDATGGEALTDDELLTDEDRVVKLIRENGGRMKQVDIVDETGWSKSKVSMLLSEMESEGTISKLRVGRENIISLEGFEPEATKSPFEE